MRKFAKKYPLMMRLFLGFVLLWFGISEIFNPKYFSGYVPEFVLKFSPLDLYTLVQIHGAVLALLSLALFFRLYIQITSMIILFVLFSIILGLIVTSGFNEIAVRDIGLFGLALSIWLYEKAKI